MKNLLTPVLIILVALIGYYYMLPMYDTITQLADKKEESNNLLSAIENMEVRLSELEGEYNELSAYEKGLLIGLVPKRVIEADLTHDLAASAARYNLDVVTVDFKGGDPAEEELTLGGVDSGSETSLPDDTLYREWEMDIVVAGAYESFKNFITDLGSNLRITDISRISIGSPEFGGDQSTYTITTRVYSIE